MIKRTLISTVLIAASTLSYANSTSTSSTSLLSSAVTPKRTDVVHIQDTKGNVLLTMEEAAVLSLPTKTFSTETPWHSGKHTFKGPLLRDVLNKAKVAKSATLEVRALNDFVTDVPVQDAYDYDVILTTHIDGKRITKRDKGPLFIMYPLSERKELNTGKFYNRSAWQIKQIIVK